jgi:hypothetical protein
MSREGGVDRVDDDDSPHRHNKMTVGFLSPTHPEKPGKKKDSFFNLLVIVSTLFGGLHF